MNRNSRSNGWPAVYAIGLAAVFFVLIHLGSWLTPTGTALSWNPVSMVIELVFGEATWPPAATWLLAAAVALLVGVAIWLWKTGPAQGGRGGRGSKNQPEKLMSSAKEIRRVQGKQRTAESMQLHQNFHKGMTPGLHIGRSLLGTRDWIYQGFRQCAVHIWGPGRGKTFGEVLRHAFHAPGAYLVTMNKVDGINEIIAIRAETCPGGRVWLYDPQQIFRKEDRPAFTFNPLTMVKDTETALDLASLFESADAADDAKKDAQFDPQGRDYLAWCMLAAALSEGSLHEVYAWVSQAEFLKPKEILQAKGLTGPTAALFGMSEQPTRTRGSVAASAQRMASPMVHDRLMRWTVPVPGIPVFDPTPYVTSKDTLILLSQEKAGSATAFVSPLVEAVFNCAEREAQLSGKRLKVPLVADLDECGNVVKLKKLPLWYTYFGSMGIIISAYFQSKSQAVEMFGENGWKKIWDAAGVRVYGGGISDDVWLRSLSALIGKHDQQITSKSTAAGGAISFSTTTREQDIMTVAQLAQLPEWRAVVQTSNAVTTIVEIVPAFEDPLLKPILDSITTGQAATRTKGAS